MSRMPIWQRSTSSCNKSSHSNVDNKAQQIIVDITTPVSSSVLIITDIAIAGGTVRVISIIIISSSISMQSPEQLSLISAFTGYHQHHHHHRHHHHHHRRRHQPHHQHDHHIIIIFFSRSHDVRSSGHCYITCIFAWTASLGSSTKCS